MLQLYSKDMPWPIAFDSSFDNMSTRNKQGRNKVSNEQHKALLELRRTVFNKWVKNPLDKDLTKQLDLLDKVLFG